MRYVRVLAMATVDNPSAPPIWIDAIADDQGTILGRHALFGVQGDFTRRDEHFYPFVLYSTGEVDFGMGYDEKPNERFGRLDLRNGPLAMGRLLTLSTHNYGGQRYRIQRVDTLPGG